MKSLLARLSVLSITVAIVLSLLGIAVAEDDWRTDFDAACASTSDAMGLTVPQLKALLEKCDRVQKAIEQQDETVRKVYLKRLQMCRNLYAYMLEYKKNGQGAP